MRTSIFGSRFSFGKQEFFLTTTSHITHPINNGVNNTITISNYSLALDPTCLIIYSRIALEGGPSWSPVLYLPQVRIEA
jgi:hypothetical protein